MLLTIFHVIAGTVAMLSGGAAMALRKGGPGHRLAGKFFGVSMVLMAASAAIMAIIDTTMLNLISAMVTFYLVATGWLAASAKTATNRLSLVAGMLFGSATALAGYATAWRIATGPPFVDGVVGQVPPAFSVTYVIFGTLALWAVIQDASVIRRGTLTGTARIRRHLWRMGVALTIATAAFFLGQQDEMPTWILGRHLFVPTLAAIGLTFFWLFRLRERRPRPLPLETRY